MKLYATTTSERGKEVNKGGNEYINILINDENRENKFHILVEWFKIGGEEEIIMEVLNYATGKTIGLSDKAK